MNTMFLIQQYLRNALKSWTTAGVGIMLLGFSTSGIAISQSSPNCATATPISGVGTDWAWGSYGNSGFPVQNCGFGATADTFYKWTAEESGTYRFTVYSHGAYCHFEVYSGSSCFGTYVGCGTIGHSDYYASVNAGQVQAGDEFIVRAVAMAGTLQVAKMDYDCQAASNDLFVNNNDCTTPATIGNGSYYDLAVSDGDTDYYRVCIEPGDQIYLKVDPRFYQEPIHLQLRDPTVFPCDTWVGPGVLGNTWTSTLGYQNTTGVRQDALITVRASSSFMGCKLYDLHISGVNGCGGFPTTSTFCDPMNANTTGQSTHLEAIGGSGIHSGVRLEATHGPPNQFGSFIIGTGSTSPGISLGQGRFCIDVQGGNQFGRYNVQGGALNSIGLFDADGTFQNFVGTSQTGSGFDVPTYVPTLNQYIRVGETWHFQMWHREPNGGSNFSNGVSVMFQSIP